MKNRLHVMLLMMLAGWINRHQQEMIDLSSAKIHLTAKVTDLEVLGRYDLLSQK